jgi:hypothetical protein
MERVRRTHTVLPRCVWPGRAATAVCASVRRCRAKHPCSSCRTTSPAAPALTPTSCLRYGHLRGVRAAAVGVVGAACSADAVPPVTPQCAQQCRSLGEFVGELQTVLVSPIRLCFVSSSAAWRSCTSRPSLALCCCASEPIRVRRGCRRGCLLLGRATRGVLPCADQSSGARWLALH